MAIIIPSKNIYGDTENPKVRDNVIERIEVEAVEVVPDNDYETPVYNEKVFTTQQNIYPTTVDNQEANGTQFAISGGGWTNSRRSASYVGYLEQKTLKTQIKIPVTKDNKYISALLTGINEENKEENIKYSLYGVEKIGSCSASWDYSVPSTVILITIGEINYSPPTEISVEKSIVLPPKISIRENSDSQNQVSSSAEQSIKKWGNIETAKADLQTIGEKDYYILNLEIPCGVKTVGMTHFDNISTEDKNHIIPTKLSFNGSYTIYEPTQVAITIYGNTIGIDLQDKTLYVNGKTAKKVHSVSGNELMQTSNYYSENKGVTKQNNYLEYLYGETQKSFKNGKETATIRCSISDYYDGDKKVISIDNSTGRMSFNEGDKVIPMVYGADGKDRPMSLYQNGNPKVFTVLGTKKYYNGAVWQELYLQET